MLSLEIAAELPEEVIAIRGSAPATEAPILLLLITLPSFPVEVPVEKKRIPVVTSEEDPKMEQLRIVLFLASPMKRIVAVPEAPVL
jgi:hypothetical protein